MKIFKSIKWRLQIWYGLILVVVLAGFGFTAYQLERNRQFRRIDDELHRRVGVLAKRCIARRRAGRMQTDRLSTVRRPDQIPDDGPPRTKSVAPPVEFHLPPEAAHLFDTNDPHDFYFIIESRDGRGNRAFEQCANIRKQAITVGNFRPMATANTAAGQLACRRN